MLIALMNEGKGDLDHSALALFIEGLGGTQVERPKAAAG